MGSKWKKTTIFLGVLLALIVLGVVFKPNLGGIFTNVPTLSLGTPTPQSGLDKLDVACEDIQCNVIPTYTYNAVDKFGSTITTTGTTYIKQNGDFAVTTLASPVKCSALKFWNSNGTSFCPVVDEPSAVCGSKQLQAKCWINATGSSLIVLNAQTGAQYTDNGGATNISVSTANSVTNAKLSFTSGSKTANMPFGGCLVIEHPTTIASVTPSGSGVSTAGCPYKLTYTPVTAGNTYSAFAVPSGFDASGDGSIKDVNVQFKVGTSGVTAGSLIYFTYVPANYYLTNTGDFALGLERDQNQDTTRTFLATIRAIIGTI
jgi:hypothetical protein